jgi:hypothetical protein
MIHQDLLKSQYPLPGWRFERNPGIGIQRYQIDFLFEALKQAHQTQRIISRIIDIFNQDVFKRDLSSLLQREIAAGVQQVCEIPFFIDRDELVPDLVGGRV